MKIVESSLSPELTTLFLEWCQEYETNIQHDMSENKAWNALVSYLMELERKVS